MKASFREASGNASRWRPASPIGWHRWAGDEGAVIGVERFGASAPGQDVLDHLGFTADHVAAAALRLLGKNNEADAEYGS